MYLKSNKQKEILLKHISSLSVLIRRLCLYCNFISKSKSLNYTYIKSIIKNIKICIEDIEKIL